MRAASLKVFAIKSLPENLAAYRASPCSGQPVDGVCISLHVPYEIRLDRGHGRIKSQRHQADTRSQTNMSVSFGLIGPTPRLP
jgi:hypothetical protein